MRAPTPEHSAPPAPVMTGLTWQEFLDHPEEFRHADLINGELFVNAPTLLHQRIGSRLLTALVGWTDGGADRGEAIHEPAVQISHDRGYMPDIAWWPQDRCAPAGQPPAFDGPPGLVVEVLSPSTRRLDLLRKRNDYPRIGVAELWFIDPKETSALMVRASDGREHAIEVTAPEHLSSPMLDGFTAALASLARG